MIRLRTFGWTFFKLYIKPTHLLTLLLGGGLAPLLGHLLAPLLGHPLALRLPEAGVQQLGQRLQQGRHHVGEGLQQRLDGVLALGQTCKPCLTGDNVYDLEKTLT